MIFFSFAADMDYNLLITMGLKSILRKEVELMIFVKLLMVLLFLALLFSVSFQEAIAVEEDAAEEGTIGVQIADYIMKKWPNPDRITTKQWEYTNGIIFYGMELIGKKSRDPKYLSYIKRWVDQYVDKKGRIYPIRSGHNLDIIQPSNLLFDLAEASQDPRYRLCATETRKKFADFPVNSEGGFWHKANYPNQMWADGQYMAIPFIARYGATFAEPGADQEDCYRTAVYQLKLFTAHALNQEKKLLYHGWNDNKTAEWAHPETGLSPEFWSRGLGWYSMALVDTLEYLPADYPGCQDLKVILQTIAEGLAKYQDPRTGLWFQVIDKGDHPGNWLETSGSAMFIYTLRKASQKGYIDAKYEAVADKGWSGIKSMVDITPKGEIVIRGSVQGMGVQTSYANYINKERVDNLPHGMAAIMMAASVMEY